MQASLRVVVVYLEKSPIKSACIGQQFSIVYHNTVCGNQSTQPLE